MPRAHVRSAAGRLEMCLGGWAASWGGGRRDGRAELFGRSQCAQAILACGCRCLRPTSAQGSRTGSADSGGDLADLDSIDALLEELMDDDVEQAQELEDLADMIVRVRGFARCIVCPASKGSAGSHSRGPADRAQGVAGGLHSDVAGDVADVAARG